MKYPNKLFGAILFIVCYSTASVASISILDQIEAMLRSARDPLERLTADLALEYASCAATFRLAYAQRDTSEGNETFSRGKKCQAEMLAEGNANIEKVKATLPKPGAQAALKDLTLYWRVQLSEVSYPHSEADSFVFLKNLKAYEERVRLEAEW